MPDIDEYLEILKSNHQYNNIDNNIEVTKGASILLSIRRKLVGVSRQFVVVFAMDNMSGASENVSDEINNACDEVGEINNGCDGKQLLIEFIELYETLPEVWDSRRKDYMSKSKRHSALEKLLECYKKIKPNATREDVRKKINSLRTNYRKELKKIISSKRSGAGTEEVYKPTSWIFYALQFLGSCELPVNANLPGTTSTEVSL